MEPVTVRGAGVVVAVLLLSGCSNFVCGVTSSVRAFATLYANACSGIRIAVIVPEACNIIAARAEYSGVTTSGVVITEASQEIPSNKLKTVTIVI
jgi:hypothetical protein